MDEFEANLIILNCSPMPIQRSASPQSVASYSLSQKMVQSCKNCKYSFRTEFKPNAQYCSKDCETSFRWFMKKSDSCEDQPTCCEDHHVVVDPVPSKSTSPVHEEIIITEEIIINDCQDLHFDSSKLQEFRVRNISFHSHDLNDDDYSTVVPTEAGSTSSSRISSRASSPSPSRKMYKKPDMIYADTKASAQIYRGVRTFMRKILF